MIIWFNVMCFGGFAVFCSKNVHFQKGPEIGNFLSILDMNVNIPYAAHIQTTARVRDHVPQRVKLQL